MKVMKRSLKNVVRKVLAVVCSIGIGATCACVNLNEQATAETGNAETVKVDKYIPIGEYSSGKQWVDSNSAGYNNIQVFYDNCSPSTPVNDFEPGYNEKARICDSKSKNNSTGGKSGQIGSMKFDNIITDTYKKYSLSFDFKVLDEKYLSNPKVDEANDKAFQLHFQDSENKYVNYLRLNDGYIVLSLSGGSMGRYTSDNVDHKVIPYEVGKWTNVEYTVDTQTGEINWYINGVLVAEGTIGESYSQSKVAAKAILSYGNLDADYNYEDFLELDNFKTAYVTEDNVSSIDTTQQILYNDYENESKWNPWLKGYFGTAERVDTENSIHGYAAKVKYKGISGAAYDSLYFSGYRHHNSETNKYYDDFSDVYSVSFDIKIPNETLGMFARGLGYTSEDTEGEQGFFGFIFDKAGYFGASPNWFSADVDSTLATASMGKSLYKSNDWNAVDMVIDKTNKTVSIYLNGGLMKTLNVTSTAANTMMIKAFALNAKQSESGFYVDNMRVVNIANNTFWYDAVFVDDNIVLDFNQQLVNQNLDAIKVYDENNSEIALASVRYDGHKVILTPSTSADYYRIEMPEHTVGSGGYLLSNRTATVKKPRFKFNATLTANNAEIASGELDKISDGAEIKLNATYENTTANDENVFMIAAAYDKDGRLISVSAKNGTATKNTENGSIDDVPSFSFLKATKALKAFVWSRNNSGPLIENIILDNRKSAEYPISDTTVRQLGRYAVTASDGRTYNWPGSGIEYTFTGTETAVNVSEISGPYVSDTDTISMSPTADNSPYFTIEIDGVYKGRVGVTKTGWLTLASGLENTEHTVKFTRSGEATRGKLSADKIRVLSDADESAAKPKNTAAKSHKLEFYGDSYTVGYANVYDASEIQSSGAVWETGKNTDFYNSYVGIVSRAFDADANVIASSGKGIVKNGDGSTETTITNQIGLADLKIRKTDAPSAWNFNDYTPNAVVIFLGTNDKSANVSDNDFAKGYSDFISKLAEKYGTSGENIKYILITKPGLYENAVNTMLDDLGWSKNGDDNMYFFKYSKFETDEHTGHPTKEQHLEIAKETAEFIKQATGWSYTEIK